MLIISKTVLLSDLLIIRKFNAVLIFLLLFLSKIKLYSDCVLPLRIGECITDKCVTVEQLS